MTSTGLHVEGVSQKFGGLIAVNDLSFHVKPGEIFGIIGPNGAGKTTVLNCISGLNRYQAGRIVLDDDLLTGRRPHRIAALGVARTLQAADFFAEFTLTDYLLLGRLRWSNTKLIPCAIGTPSVRRSERAEKKRARDVLDRFGLGARWREPVGILPYGSRKLLDVLRALLMEPRLLLLDEPTSGTAVTDRAELRVAMEEIRRAKIMTLVIDHNVDFVAGTCDRALAMSFGRLLDIGAPRELLANDEVREVFLGLNRQEESE